MLFSKQTTGWLKVYILFPCVPVIIETFFRAIFRSTDTAWTSVPAYGSALVTIMAISVFLHDSLKSYRLPAPDADLSSELEGNRYTMIYYFAIACALFVGMTIVTLLIERHAPFPLDYPLNVLRVFAAGTVLFFLRKSVLLQQQYKLAVSI